MREEELIKKTEELLAPLLTDTAIEIYDIEYVKEGQDYILRIYIDKENGVGINDCELVSRRIEKALDDTDLIKKRYVLEVSSPGIERRPKRQNLNRVLCVEEEKANAR